MELYNDPNAAKYLITARIEADGVVERPDVVGAIFGQTEGLLGDDLDLRDLQKSGRIGRIEVDIKSDKGRSIGEIRIPSSLDQVETAILAAALETIDRVGPCRAHVTVLGIEDIRATKRQRVVDRAKQLLQSILEQGKSVSENIIKEVRESVEIEEIMSYGKEHLPAGPNVDKSDAIIVVEGRSDIINLLKHGIKNTIAINGTNVPDTVAELSKKKMVTAFLDGDRGGDLILKELLQVADLDFVARAPKGYEVEELTYKQLQKSLRNKMPVEQYLATHDIGIEQEETSNEDNAELKKEKFEHKAKREKKEQKENQIDTLFRELNEKKEGAIMKGNKVITRIPLNEFIEKLKDMNEKADTIITGGVISQKLVDIAHKKGITRIIGYKAGNITKRPLSIKIITKDMVKR